VIVLDTNAISEIFRPSPEARVIRWLASLTGDVAITSVTLAELLVGVRRLPDGRPKTALANSTESVLGQYRGSRSVLLFDEATVECYADVLVAREGAGAPISTADAQIAAICLAQSATCATRNTKDFEHAGSDLINPWSIGG